MGKHQNREAESSLHSRSLRLITNARPTEFLLSSVMVPNAEVQGISKWKTLQCRLNKQKKTSTGSENSLLSIFKLTH